MSRRIHAMPRSVVRTEAENPPNSEESASEEVESEEEVREEPVKTKSKSKAPTRVKASKEVTREPVEIPTSRPKPLAKAKPLTVAKRKTEDDDGERHATSQGQAVGYVYTKSGRQVLYETPSKKYYVQRKNGTKSYVTARITTGKLQVFDT